MPNFFLQKKYAILIVVVFVLVVLTTLFYWRAISAPRDFPVDSIVSVRAGAGLLELSHELAEDKVVRSPFWFRTMAIVLRGERGMRAGEYYFSKNLNAYQVAKRVARGDHRIEVLKVTIPEGFTVRRISALFDERFSFFDNEAFEEAAPEGYLFPDTYFVPINATASSTIRLLQDNFIRKIFTLMPDIEESGRSLEEIIIMASILEGEANTREDMQIVSDILWRRFDIGMPLQVDATFVYFLGKATKELTLDDLEIKSPYNTYLNRGLPPTPISNPGLDSIWAATHPKETQYLFFLTGDDGEMYYSRNHDEHIRYKRLYIDNNR